ncbi:uncharacterized protein SPAPADRAFT_48591 [Spathaspora passalidarum NRRL Y-27907]|uniref:ATP-dependent DNA helicase n=1 Tax=Spathaspora passalidarum (strain NRRL Y-27907 / 11-Y1) TaxID=619300 RepID=G3AE77_SPAPN|nr:uncharacterized protein SPAPADRAFT_48591 [Spathaspora passalidarum NRRL Y-27907]EGW35611.1 hypothetical protein SPAPADRAFT_48591 [Spathaspora passalidarum NRRL Y-27907]
MPVIPIHDEEDDDDWAFDDEEEDPELQQILQNGVSSKRQRTLDGNIVPTITSVQQLPKPIPVNIPSHHPIDYENLKTYIYPTNFQIRDYQYNIVQRAFYDNLLVALPTGLGKTFIASTVMLNFLRWFPQSKIIFMAPTRPLVAQQIKACCSITGIPSSKVAILLDKTRKNREEIWDTRQVFFTTPQVVENDLARGILNPKSVVLLVIDEAHRARGNYSYNNVVKFLSRFNNSFRILALTATPAGDVEGVQDIIDNLKISKVEVRTEHAIDITKYMKRKQIVKRTVNASSEIQELIGLLATAISPVLKSANERGVFDITDPTRINHFQCMEASRKVTMNRTMPSGLKWSNFYMLQLLGVVGQCYRRLNIYGVRSFYTYFNEKYNEFKGKKSKSQINSDFYFSDEIKQVLKRSDEVLKGKGYSHPKIETLMDELTDFFADGVSSDSRVIIFTEYRESALEIVQCIERTETNLKPHIFIGQSKEKERFDETKSKTKGKSKKRAHDGDDDVRDSTRTSSEDAQIKGMNQKLQKEIIKKFKAGAYNILVATSIGEEGLDIGEVDLIICYDSTSSPIKNIQRMGRTGRKRDGKVVLLFSSNEELKFDKAMAGYEYIQQHIQKGDLITLCSRNRIIPDIYTPKVVEQFIEIPDENIELKSEDDEDEIIRIATQYMLGGSQKKKKSTKKPLASKKKFFMPDNVETGFQSVTNMIKKSGDEVEKKRERDILDSFLDSSDDDDLPIIANPSLVRSSTSSRKLKVVDSDSNDDIPISSTSRQHSNPQASDSPNKRQVIDLKSDEDIPIASKAVSKSDSSKKKQVSSDSDNELSIHKDLNTPASSLVSEFPVSSKSESGSIPIDLDDDFSFSSDDESEVSESTREPTPLVPSSPKPKPKSLGVKRAVVVPNDHTASPPPVTSIPVEKAKMLTKISESNFNIPSSFNPHSEIGRPKKTLGLKRTRVNILDQLKNRQSQLAATHEDINRDHSGTRSAPIVLDDIDLPNYTPDSQVCVKHELEQDQTNDYSIDVESEPDKSTISVHDSGHDTVVINQSRVNKHYDIEQKSHNSSIYEFSSDSEGLLTEDQRMQLYTNYYVPVDPSQTVQFYDPFDGLKGKKKNHGKIPHSLNTEKLIDYLNRGILEKPGEDGTDDSSFDLSSIVYD